MPKETMVTWDPARATFALPMGTSQSSSLGTGKAFP